MIFWLEIDGALKKCTVLAPYDRLLGQLNEFRMENVLPFEMIEWVRSELKAIADECAAAGAYDPCPSDIERAEGLSGG